MDKGRCFLWVMMLTGLVLVLVACSPASSSPTPATPTIDSAHHTAFAQEQSTLAPSPTPTSPPLVAGSSNVGRMPQTCAPGPTPKDVNPSLFGPGVGSPPVWAIGFAGPHATAHLQGITEDAATAKQYGWEYKILWEIGPHSQRACSEQREEEPEDEIDAGGSVRCFDAPFTSLLVVILTQKVYSRQFFGNHRW